jgi:hypothetical protein
VVLPYIARVVALRTVMAEVITEREQPDVLAVVARSKWRLPLGKRGLRVRVRNSKPARQPRSMLASP